eukprot:Pgem_evm1s15780
MNAFGGLFAATGALIEVLFNHSLGALPLVMLEGIWGAVGFHSLIMHVLKKRANRNRSDVPVCENNTYMTIER